jgi:hypothetical protein
MADFVPAHFNKPRPTIFPVEDVDDVPHGRPPLVGELIRAPMRFSTVARDSETGFVDRPIVSSENRNSTVLREREAPKFRLLVWQKAHSN